MGAHNATLEEDTADAPAPARRTRTRARKPPRDETPAAEERAPVASPAPDVEVEEPGRRHEVLGLLALAATLLAGLSLWSYDARGGENWIGAFGEWIASVLASAFGLAAWAVPLELLLATTRLFGRHRVPIGAARAASVIVVVLVGCAMLHLAMPGAEVLGGHLPGGALGEVLGEVLRSVLGLVGAFVVGLTILMVTVVLRTSFSVIEMASRVAGGARTGSRRVSGWAGSLWEAWREAKELERKEREEEAERRKPRIVTSSGGTLAPAAKKDEKDEDERFDDDEELADEDELRAAAALEEPSEQSGARAIPVEPPKKAKRAKKTDERAATRTLNETVVAEPSAELDGSDVVDDDEPVEAAPEAAPVVEEPRPAKASKPAPKGPTIVPPSDDAHPPPLPPKKPEAPKKGQFVLPPTGLLDAPPPRVMDIDEKSLRDNATKLVDKLAAYGVKGRVDEIHPGPVVTMYEMEPESGTKVSKIAALSDDLAMALAAQKVRIVAPIPGKARVGFELPNKHRQMVSLREILEDPRWDQNDKAALPVAFGKDIAGHPVYGDLAKMPHLLVAGATGAGKSVGLNVMLASLLMKRSPDEVRMLMIDPKVVELAVFDGIPHMLLPVVTDMKKAALALRWAVDEMERRYQLFADAGARNVTTYNERVEKVLTGELPPEKLCPRKKGKQVAIGAEGEEVLVDPVDGERADDIPMPTKLPYVVVVVDEFADLMMVAAKDVESAIARLAQKARAAGIHVILATQRPSVDVITGMIKANFPARIAFKVSQREDSKTILGRIGAEHLLGQGDMLMIPPGASDLRRVHSAFISEREVEALCDHLRAQGKPVYDDNILKPREDEDGNELGGMGEGGGGNSDDPLYDRAVACVATAGYCSISHIQRQLGIGYNKAAKLVEQMEKEGVVGPASGKAGGRREVLVQALS